jgi:hypothetical protein
MLNLCDRLCPGHALLATHRLSPPPPAFSGTWTRLVQATRSLETFTHEASFLVDLIDVVGMHEVCAVPAIYKHVQRAMQQQGAAHASRDTKQG